MIQLKEIDWSNVRKVIGLKVGEHQRNFVSSNADSMGEAYCSLKSDKIPMVPYGILNGDEYVGFLMYDYTPSAAEERNEIGEEYLSEAAYYHLFRYMNDEKYQGQGLGCQAMKAFIELIKSNPQGIADQLFICYYPENDGAKAFYESFGFRNSEQVVDDENITRLAL